MLVRIACPRCRLDSLWTDEPQPFLSTVCRNPRRCEATLLDEDFRGIPSLAAAGDRDDARFLGADA
jgi:hypothetical protein